MLLQSPDEVKEAATEGISPTNTSLGSVMMGLE